MLSLLVSMLVLLIVIGFFLIKPLMAEEQAEAEAEADVPASSPSIADLSVEERRVAIDELMWRIDHDLATGRIDAQEHEALKAKVDRAAATGGSA